MLFQKWWYLRVLLKYGSPLISHFERKSISKLGGKLPEYPVIFIIGPPRSGSTFIYQLITSLLDVTYMDNLSNLARNNPFTGMKLSRYFFGDRRHENYQSNFGQTESGGLHAPAEALFPYLWFPKDRHYTELTDLTEDQQIAFRTTMNSLINTSGKPLIIKNLTFSMRLKVLKEVLPYARYLVVRREPLFAAQSLFLAIQNNKVAEGNIWSIKPRNYKELVGLEPHELAVRQINLIEKQIAEDLSNVSSDKILYIDYETLDQNIDTFLSEVIRLGGGKIKRRKGLKHPEIKITNKVKLPVRQIQMLEEQIGMLKWDLHNR